MKSPRVKRAYDAFCIDGIIPIVLIIGTLMLSTSCKKDASSEETATSTEAEGSGNGFSFGTSEFFANTTSPDGGTMFLHLDGDWTAPCKINSTDSKKDITCILEASELDLYVLGTSISYNVPADICSYLIYRPYYYYQYKPGIGPTNVNLTNTNGVVTFTSTPSGGTVGATLVAGTPVCDADYTQYTPAGPNCCEGNYSLTTLTIGTPNTTSSSLSNWGGKVSNCLTGPGVDSQSKSKNGFPLWSVVYLKGKTLNDTYTISSPMSKDFITNVYAANYYGSPYTLANAPTPMKSQGTGIPAAQPGYEFRCLDHSEEILHRITVYVRSWSTDSEFNARGDYKKYGAEGAPFDFGDYTDRLGWPGVYGFGNIYPGFYN